MTIPQPLFVFRSTFEDVLSGEFDPPQEPSRRVRTLAELAKLAVSRGRYETAATNGITERGRINFFYNLPWAPHVEADVSGDMLDGIAEIDSLFYSEVIGSQYGDELIVSMADDSHLKLNGIDYELSTASSITIARIAVAQAAQEFFHDVAKNLSLIT